MNRAILLLIADFLLLSMLALARFDNEPQQESTGDVVEEDTSVGRELIEALQLSLEAERQSRLDLTENLEETSSELRSRQESLAETQARLEEESQKAKQLTKEREKLLVVAEEKKILEKEKRSLEDTYEQTRQRLDEAQEERVHLANELADAKSKSTASEEKLRVMQEALQRSETETRETKLRLEKTEGDLRVAELEKQKLGTQLQVSETEKTMLTANLATVRQEKERAEQQAEKLAVGVTELAESSTAMVTEIKELKPLSLNAVYNLYKSNRIILHIYTREKSFGGQSEDYYKFPAMVVREGNELLAVFLDSRGPFKDSGLLGVRAEAEAGGKRHALMELRALKTDPRILGMPLPASVQAFVKPADLAPDPFRFPTSIVVDEDEGFGEVLLKRNPGFADFLERDTGFISSLPGEVKPSRDDYVLAKSGHFMGLMIDKDNALLVRSLASQFRLGLGSAYSQSMHDNYLARRRRHLDSLPSSLR